MSNSLNQKRRRAERTQAFLKDLQKRFPDCFAAQRKAVKPLAIGIQQALREALDAHPETAETPNWLIRQALARYTGSPAYLEAMVDGAERIDLTGNPVERVTDAAIEVAKTRREEQKARAAERKRQQAEAAAEARRQEKIQRLADHFNQ